MVERRTIAVVMTEKKFGDDSNGEDNLFSRRTPLGATGQSEGRASHGHRVANYLATD